MLIAHIGLPKTATTTLQKHVFQALDGTEIVYLGVRQPRTLEQRTLYHDLLACVSTSEGYEENVLSVRTRLLDLQDQSDKPVVFSEEMISVDHVIPWQQKYELLAQTLDGLDYRILVSVREPVPAAYSLYVERYDKLKSDFQSFLEFCERGNNAKIFNYQILDRELSNSFGKANVCFLKFEDLSNPGAYIKGLSQTLGIEIDRDLVLPTENPKTKKKIGYRVQNRDVIELLREPIAKRIEGAGLPTAFEYLLRSVSRRFRRFSLKVAGQVVPYPDDQQSGVIQKLLVPGPEWSCGFRELDYR